MRSLLSATPSGGGAKCKKLSQRLGAGKEVLIRPATLAYGEEKEIEHGNGTSSQLVAEAQKVFLSV